MKYLMFITAIFCMIYACQEEKARLIYFTHYEYDALSDRLVNNLIEIDKQEEKYIVKVLFREGGYYTGEHIQGDFNVSNDTIFLSYKYVEEKDKYKNHYFVHSPIIAYEYHFITDKTYTFIYDSHIMDSIRFPEQFRDKDFY